MIITGGVPNSFGPGWIKAHADACKAAGKPCFFEECKPTFEPQIIWESASLMKLHLDGTPSNHCQNQVSWQKASRDRYTDGMGGDAFWQWGDRLSNGQSPNDGNTVYYGSADATCLITDHVRAINALS